MARWGDDLYRELRRTALRTDVKVDYEVVRSELVTEIRRLGLTVSSLPKAVSGWTGLSGEAA